MEPSISPSPRLRSSSAHLRDGRYRDSGDGRAAGGLDGCRGLPPGEGDRLDRPRLDRLAAAEIDGAAEQGGRLRRRLRGQKAGQLVVQRLPLLELRELRELRDELEIV